MATQQPRPDYAHLRSHDGKIKSSWETFPADDEIGTINLITGATVVDAARIVTRGAIFNLDYAVDAFEPFWSGTRKGVRHVHFGNNPLHHDDYLDSFYLQTSSQIDGLRHFGDPTLGFYGGATAAELNDDPKRLGIHRWAEHGIVGRGILLDVARYRESIGRPIHVGSTDPISLADLTATAEAHGVHARAGDILLIRTGWAGKYLALPSEERSAFDAAFVSIGLDQREDIVEWIWDTGFSLVAADNVGVEQYPFDPSTSDYFDPKEAAFPVGLDHRGMLHRPLIAGLGLALGELWALDELANHCAEDGRYEFLLVCKPLTVIGAAGSPANAIAVK